MDIDAYWNAVLTQNEEGLRAFFHDSATIRWHNTNEAFTADEFIQANCTYPGSWAGEIQRCVNADSCIVTAVHVYTPDQTQHFHVTSFFDIVDGKIASLDEYWGDDGPVPSWRKALCLGKPIK